MVRFNDRPDMASDIYRGRKTTKQQQQKKTRITWGGCGGRGRGGKGLQLYSEILHCLRTVI